MIVPHRAAKMRRGAFFASGAYFHKGHTSNNLLFVGIMNNSAVKTFLLIKVDTIMY